jgi:hypothetical protein
MEQEQTFWTERLQVREQGYAKVVAHGDVVHSTQREFVPLYFATHSRQGGARPDVNWQPGDASQRGLTRVEEHWVRLDPESLRLASGETEFPVPAPATNPVFRFTDNQREYVVDGVSILERMVGLREQLFTVLLSPFRELVVRARRVDDVVSLVVNTIELHRMGLKQHPLIMNDADTSCLAFWASSAERLMDLGRCGSSILRGERLQVPRLGCTLSCQVRGLTDGKTIYVQSLMPGASNAAHRDLLWRDGWSSIRMTRPRGRGGQEVFDRSAAYHHEHLIAATAALHKCRRRELGKSEVDEVRRVVGWNW